MRQRLERVVGASSNFKNSDIMKEYICKHYGSLDKCAEELNVGRSTVYRWVQSNPRGILLHAPEILRDKDTTALTLISEVVFREGELATTEA